MTHALHLKSWNNATSWQRITAKIRHRNPPFQFGNLHHTFRAPPSRSNPCDTSPHRFSGHFAPRLPHTVTHPLHPHETPLSASPTHMLWIKAIPDRRAGWKVVSGNYALIWWSDWWNGFLLCAKRQHPSLPLSALCFVSTFCSLQHCGIPLLLHARLCWRRTDSFRLDVRSNQIKSWL